MENQIIVVPFFFVVKVKKGICFSGGGIKAFAHIGALKAIEEKGLKFDMVSRNIIREYNCSVICVGVYK